MAAGLSSSGMGIEDVRLMAEDVLLERRSRVTEDFSRSLVDDLRREDLRRCFSLGFVASASRSRTSSRSRSRSRSRVLDGIFGHFGLSIRRYDRFAKNDSQRHVIAGEVIG